MKLSIVIPVHNNWNFTRSCLADLNNLPLSSDHEIIVVDNGSTDNTQKGFNAAFGPGSGMELFDLGANTGFAHACGYGYKQSMGEYVMFLNNDVRVQSNHEDWTKPIIEAASENCLVGPTGGILDDNLNFVTETDKLQDGNFYMSGWCLTASKKTFDKLTLPEYDGPFTEEFGIAYFEDTDLSFRAKELGMKFKIVDVPVMHIGKVTSKKLNTLSLYLPAKRKFIEKWQNRLSKKS